MAALLPKTINEWRKALNDLPSTPDNIPAFYFAHGSPLLAFDSNRLPPEMGSNGPLATFLKDFGPALLEKYQPKGIAVFSAHWETSDIRGVTDYGNENPLLYDYYGFPPELYQFKFISPGDHNLSQRIVQLYQEAGCAARTTTEREPRGSDGRGFKGPGLDHGVFIPFRLMFGEKTDLPIVEISIDASLDPERNWAIGKAIQALRKEGILVLSGGLTIHNLGDVSAFSPATATPIYFDFDQAVLDSVLIANPEERKLAMINLTRHRAFKAAHPTAEHFVPLYVAAGGGEGGAVKILAALHGAATIAFGL